jgi:hypothetical protein
LAALLAAISVPNMVKARTTACKNSCIANLKQIDGAIQQWALENKKVGTDMVNTKEFLDYPKGSVLPVCPQAGAYPVTSVSDMPTCTLSSRGHSP